MTGGLVIRPFEPSFQDEALRLIQAGLAEHFGTLDPARNPDLRDIAGFYGAENFYVAFVGDEMVGTAALKHESDGSCRIARMSVRPEYRRRGVGTAMLDHLLSVAAARGYTRIVLETTRDWHAAQAFYRANGFRIVSVDEARADVNFERRL